MCAARCDSFDAVIVGSGISGALIAKQLGLKGKKVLIMEAGAETPPDINRYMDRFYRSAAKVPEMPYTPELFTGPGLTDPATVNAGRPTVLTLGPHDASKFQFGDWKDPKQAYLIQEGPRPFASTYERINGGTVRHWLGTSLRFVPNDFKMNTQFQQFVDWPIDYGDLSPWYGMAESEIGVSADVKEQAELQPFPPDYSYPMPAIPQSLVDKAVADAVKGLVMDGIELKVVTTPAGRNSQPYQNRRVCAGNTNCIPICPIQAKYDPSVTLADALRTGNVTIWFRTVASEVVVGENDRISEIRYRQYEEDTGPQTREGCVTATVFILAAHAIETPKLLLMSSKQRPDGVANSSKLVGKNLMDHPIYLAWALMPPGKNVFGYRGPLSTAGIENVRDGDFRRTRAAFRVEIGNEGWSFPKGDPYTTVADFINGTNYSKLNDGPALFGRDLAVKLSDLLSRQFRLGFLLEQSPEESNSVSLSTTHTDHLGLPRPLIRYDLSDYTKKGFVAAKKTADAIFARLGATQHTEPPAADDPAAFVVDVDGQPTRLTYFGAGHIVGTYRMGTTKANSVVNREQRSWDHPNLFLVGSGVFPTVATANPTLTLAALSLWAADTVLKTDLK